MSLTLAIPVKDDHGMLDQLIEQARQMDIFDQIVVVDDGSTPPIDVPRASMGSRGVAITLLRHEHPRGAGVARNHALEHVTAQYLVYMDSDDRFAPEFPDIWRTAQTKGVFDLCLFRHHDTRREAFGGWGQMPQDEALWRRAGLAQVDMKRASPEARSQLVETANYPWNKIYRTAFLQQNGLGCADCPVHNDITLHWGAMLHAETVLASSRVGVVHRVRYDGDRLTNQRGHERLQVFDVLTDVLKDLSQARERRDLVLSFLRFSSGLFEWIRGQIPPQSDDAYRIALRNFLVSHLTDALCAELAQRDPVLCLKLLLQMADGCEGIGFPQQRSPSI